MLGDIAEFVFPSFREGARNVKWPLIKDVMDQPGESVALIFTVKLPVRQTGFCAVIDNEARETNDQIHDSRMSSIHTKWA